MANPEITVDVQHLQEENANQRPMYGIFNLYVLLISHALIDHERRFVVYCVLGRSVLADQNGTSSETTTTTKPANSAPKDTRTMRKCPAFNTIFNHKRKFLPIWNNIFVISCVFAVSCDPLFYYIPIINEKSKCLSLDTRLKTIALVLRLLTDLFYIADITVRILTSIAQVKSSAPNSEAKKSVKDVLAIAKRAWEKANRSYILIDILAILPIPQVGVIVLFSKMKGPRFLEARKALDCLVLLQFVPRVLPVHLFCRESSKTFDKASMWTKGVFNFFLYILASHILGALWYFFSIQREMDCWHYVCQGQNGCQPSSFSCGEHRLSNISISLLNESCLIKQPLNDTQFNFGIFVGALESGIVHSTDFPLKFLNCFWWGLRQLSSLGQNLATSTYAWEILFAVFISILGWLLFIYLIGNFQTYLQLETTRSEKHWRKMKTLRRNMETKSLEVELWLSREGLPINLKEVIMEIIKQKLELNQDVQVENILSVLPSEHSIYIKRYLRLAILKKVPMLQTVGVNLLKAICEHLEPVDYPEDRCFFREGDRLNKMIFITRGTVQTYMTNRKGGKIDSQFLEKGDFYGADELLTWASKFCSFEDLPTSMRMVKAVTKVEAFELSADDLKRVAIKYWWHFTKNKKLIDFSRSMLEKFAEASIKKEVCRRKVVKSHKQAKEKQTIKSQKIGYEISTGRQQGHVG